MYIFLQTLPQAKVPGVLQVTQKVRICDQAGLVTCIQSVGISYTRDGHKYVITLLGNNPYIKVNGRIRKQFNYHHVKITQTAQTTQVAGDTFDITCDSNGRIYIRTSPEYSGKVIIIIKFLILYNDTNIK